METPEQKPDMSECPQALANQAEIKKMTAEMEQMKERIKMLEDHVSELH